MGGGIVSELKCMIRSSFREFKVLFSSRLVIELCILLLQLVVSVLMILPYIGRVCPMGSRTKWPVISLSLS